MNKPIGRLFGLVVILFAILVGFTSRWTVFEAKSLRDNPLNRRVLLEELEIDRGTIFAHDGTVLAKSVKGPGKTWKRQYPQGPLFVQSVGWSFPAQGIPDTGTELFRRDALLGRSDSLSSAWVRIQGHQKVGNDVKTWFDQEAQRVALRDLAGRAGSVVALDPRTGAVRVMASVPDFNPTDLNTARKDPTSPLLNRATQAGYPPGSTFKVVTAVAAIDSGKYTAASTVDGKSPQTFSGVPLNNDDKVDYGPVDLTTALTFSINTAWANVASDLGRDTMGRYMRRFGFDAKPQLDYPDSQMVSSGARVKGSIVPPTDPNVDIARLGIGQDKLSVTPLQMAEVAAAVANRGVLMKPRIGDRIIDPDGRTIKRIGSEQQSRVMKPSTASIVTEMMKAVVKEGTGTAAALNGIEVAGKTGTAQIDPLQNITQPWFIAFAPADHPTIAIAVTVERSLGGFGGTVAAPIARDVLEVLLRNSVGG
ncbi:MAG: penicillin-binding transpeptidase domain-containing protein [Actinomycetes bacterium]